VSEDSAMSRMEKLLMRYSGPPPTVQVLFEGEPVAELKSVRGKYQFRYLPGFKVKGLASLPGFTDLEKCYESVDLFPFFEERIPDLRRPEIREWVRTKGLDEQDRLALLCALGRRSVTDSYELRLNNAA